MRKVAFLSKKCGHCKRLLDEYADVFLSSDLETIFTEEENFSQEYRKVNNFLKHNYPELAKYEYVVPMIVIFNEDNEVVNVLPGYFLASNYLDSLKEKISKNNV